MLPDDREERMLMPRSRRLMLARLLWELFLDCTDHALAVALLTERERLLTS